MKELIKEVKIVTAEEYLKIQWNQIFSYLFDYLGDLWPS